MQINPCTCSVLGLDALSYSSSATELKVLSKSLLAASFQPSFLLLRFTAVSSGSLSYKLVWILISMAFDFSVLGCLQNIHEKGIYHIWMNLIPYMFLPFLNSFLSYRFFFSMKVVNDDMNCDVKRSGDKEK